VLGNDRCSTQYSIGFLSGDYDQSPTAGHVEVKLPTTGVLPTPVPSSSSSERLDYSGDDDADWDNVYTSPDTSKYSHLTKEEISVEETPASTSSATGRSSHFKDLPSPIPRIGNISTCLDIHVFLAPLLTLFS